MTLDELIRELEGFRASLGGGTRVLVDGYEDGCDDIDAMEPCVVWDQGDNHPGWSGRFQESYTFTRNRADARMLDVLVLRR